jgi:hypothetical protein
MATRSQFTAALAAGLFLTACIYVGYANELLKTAISPAHRGVLMVGFLLGAGSASRWISTLDIKRNMAKIKRLRSSRR